MWETNEEKQDRLKGIWLQLKKKNALGGEQAQTTEEQQELTKQLVTVMRRVRWRID